MVSDEFCVADECNTLEASGASEESADSAGEPQGIAEWFAFSKRISKGRTM